jgi:hypothetical protein
MACESGKTQRTRSPFGRVSLIHNPAVTDRFKVLVGQRFPTDRSLESVTIGRNVYKARPSYTALCPGHPFESMRGSRRMYAEDLFPSDITELESRAGFVVMDITNPDAHQFGRPPTILSVVLQFDASHRIIKTRLPDGNVLYQLQRFGKWLFQNDSEEPEWKPGRGEAIDPSIAAENAPRWVAASHADQRFFLMEPPPLQTEEG